MCWAGCLNTHLHGVCCVSCRALNKLPSGSSSAVETPDLQPNFVGGKPPRLGAQSVGIKTWQLQQQRWMLARAGGNTLMDKMSSTASWQFYNVTAEGYTEPDCFAAAVVQVRGVCVTPCAAARLQPTDSSNCQQGTSGMFEVSRFS